MAKYIIDWSDEADDTFKSTFDNLVKQFSIKIANKFIDSIDELLVNLLMNNKLCPKSKQVNLRKCVTHKNTSLIYKLDGKIISLVTFIDNRSDHQF